MATGNWPALADLLKVDLAKLLAETDMSGSFGHLGRLTPLSYFPEPSIPYNNQQTSPAEWVSLKPSKITAIVEPSMEPPVAVPWPPRRELDFE